ncbi:MAG: hypothetical protein KZQ89_10800 [Candidatus Thiodiazotropha sp. (ex Lucinoma kastoroae)]|nr:hypothetical protein [Candidatus Thiodiazotropha sp. (ex Lucinoma kastoroae)]
MKQFLLICSLFFLFSTTTYANNIITTKGNKKSGTPHVVLMGASYLKGWTLDKIDCLAVVNKGVSGETSAQVRERFEVDALTAKPKAVIIWGHINDFSNAPKDKERQTRKTAIENLKNMLDTAKQQGVIPVVATEITLGVPADIKSKIMHFLGKIRGKRSHQQYISSNVLAVNEWIRSYAKDQGISVLDIEKLMTNEEGNRKVGYFKEDLSHITDQAYRDLHTFALPLLQGELINKHGLCN